MKYFFSKDCYWDNVEEQVFRDGMPVKITPSQKKVLVRLLKSNGQFVPHEDLYFTVYGSSNPSGSWKASLSNLFTRKKDSEKGLLIRVPEIEPFFENSKSEIGGGYKITVPPESIVDDAEKHEILLEQYHDIWYSKKYLENQQRNSRNAEGEWLSRKAKQYLQGFPCSWPLIFAASQYAPVKRDVVDTLKEAVLNEPSVIVLTGAGGEGKTTVLMQLCAELFYSGKTVLYHAPTYKYDIPGNLSNGIILIDNPYNPSNTRYFKDFLARAIGEGLTIVIASRSNEWIALKQTFSDDVLRSIREIEIPKLSGSESSAFAQYIKNNVHEVKRSTAELERLFYKDSYGFLYASMLMAIYNTDSLEKIAEGIIKRIFEFENGITTLKILAAIVFAEQSGTCLGTHTFRSLCKEFSINDGDVRRNLRKEVVLNGSVYQTRHEIISQLFYKYLFEEGDDGCYLDEEHREDVIIAVLEEFFGKVDNGARILSPTESLTKETSSLCVQAYLAISYEETLQFVTQRLVESCQQCGRAIIDQVYYHVDNDSVKDNLAMKCFECNLPFWGVYHHWLQHLLSEAVSLDTILDYLKKLCIEMNALDVELWNLWINLQEQNLQNNNISIDEIRMIYKFGQNTLKNNEHFWYAWASFEERHNNLGSVSTEYSARWLLREGCNHISNCSQLWMKWAEIEINLGNVGNYERVNSAAWIYKEACIGHDVPDFQLWLKWAYMEEKHGNIGNYQKLYCSAWIFKEVCTVKFSNDKYAWLEWALFVERHKETRSLLAGFPLEDTLKAKCLSEASDDSPWLAWAVIEETTGNIGDYTTEHSAAWLYQNTCFTHSMSQRSTCLFRWARFAYQHPMQDADGELIDAKYVLDYARRTCASFSYSTWADLIDFEKEIGYR